MSKAQGKDRKKIEQVIKVIDGALVIFSEGKKILSVILGIIDDWDYKTRPYSWSVNEARTFIAWSNVNSHDIEKELTDARDKLNGLLLCPKGGDNTRSK